MTSPIAREQSERPCVGEDVMWVVRQEMTEVVVAMFTSEVDAREFRRTRLSLERPFPVRVSADGIRWEG